MNSHPYLVVERAPPDALFRLIYECDDEASARAKRRALIDIEMVKEADVYRQILFYPGPDLLELYDEESNEESDGEGNTVICNG